ncbi:hypothetical protein [Nocardia brasiliensis]|uniref:hypothetical protein n=1 Tax=Nocardia brasiliensis TaxID=37326 RepID=UPI0011B1FFEE|nr:hypothetical protein [Nocardia brasiliensis]
MNEHNRGRRFHSEPAARGVDQLVVAHPALIIVAPVVVRLALVRHALAFGICAASVHTLVLVLILALLLLLPIHLPRHFLRRFLRLFSHLHSVLSGDCYSPNVPHDSEPVAIPKG